MAVEDSLFRLSRVMKNLVVTVITRIDFVPLLVVCIL